MARLPKPGSDDGQWGDILNTYLSQAHNSDGSLKPLKPEQITGIAPVATSGSYHDLQDKPTAADVGAVSVDDALQLAPSDAQSLSGTPVTTGKAADAGHSHRLPDIDNNGYITLLTADGSAVKLFVIDGVVGADPDSSAGTVTPAFTFSDDFNRANGPIGNGWTATSGQTISNGKVIGTSYWQYDQYSTRDFGSSNGAISADATGANTFTQLIIVRYVDPNNWIGIYNGGISKYAAGTETKISTEAWTDGGGMRTVFFDGPNITVVQNSQIVCTAVCTDFVDSTLHGFAVRHKYGSIDNFTFTSDPSIYDQALFIDHFSRSDGANIGGAWSVPAGNWALQSGAAAPTVTPALATVNSITASDYTVSARLTSNGAMVTARTSGTGDFYALRRNSASSWDLISSTSGTITVLKSNVTAGGSVPNSAYVGLRVSGPIITAVMQGVVKVNAYDTTHAAGPPGIYAASGTPIVDDVLVFTADPAPPPMDTLQDDFTSLDASKWTSDYGTWTADGQLHGTTTDTGSSQYARLYSIQDFLLINSQFSVQISGTSTTWIGAFPVSDTNNGGAEAVIYPSTSQLELYIADAAGNTVIDQTITYDPVAHAWLRISANTSTVTFSASPDGQTWTNLTSGSGTGFIFEAVQAYIGASGNDPGSYTVTADKLNLT